MRNILSGLIFTFLILSSAGQEGHADTIVRNTGLFVDIEAISFFKNNEYYNPITEGYTLPGSFIRPSVVYAPGPAFELKLGLHQQLYAGSPKFTKPSVLFSSAWRISPSTVLTVGSLNGSDSHRMFDPLFDTERLYSDYNETGLSLVSETSSVFSDTWVNWENFIVKGDTVREIFTAGESFSYTFPLAGEELIMVLPVQAKFKHYGGQISNYASRVVTYFNLAAGSKVVFAPAGKKYGTAAVEYLWFGFRDLTGNGDAGVTAGSASWIRMHYSFRNLYFGSYLWLARNFFSPDGNRIYSSVSDYQTGLVVPYRKILTTAAYITIRPGGLFEFLAGFEGYYDMSSKRMCSAVAIHLRFDRRIDLRGTPWASNYHR